MLRLNFEHLLMGMGMLIIGLLLLNINLNINQNYTNLENKLNSQELLLQNQITKSNFLLESNTGALERIANINDVKNFQRTHTGVYSSATENILVTTKNRTFQEVCLTFLHEIGHAKDYREQTNSELEIEREKYANDYSYNNAWRCEGLE
jgi:hypothetical protein